MERNRLPQRGGRRARASGNATLLVMAVAAIAAALALWFWLKGSAADAVSASANPDKNEYAYSAAAGGQLFRSTPGRGNAFAPTPTTDAPPDPIRISRDAARQAVSSGVLQVTLPNRTTYPVRFERQETSPSGDWTFVGRVNTRIGKLAAVITFGRAGVFGVLPTPDGRMMHIVTNHGQAFIQPAGGLLPVGMPSGTQIRDIAIPKAAAARQVRNATAPNTVRAPRAVGADKLRPTAAVAAGPEVRINVLGVYTTNLVALRGSVAAAESEFTNLIAVANQAHIDSGTIARIYLVGMRQVDYTAGLFNHEALYALQENRLPGLDVYTLRDAMEADLVAMLRPYADGDDSCGIAYVSGADLSPDAASSDYGFSVTATESCGPLVLSHEIGHNMGSVHDVDNSEFPGAYPFSYGYRQNGPPAFATVMAYASGAQSWVGYFSNPNIASCLSAHCGVANQADNVRSINLMADRISRFRDPLNTISVLDAASIFEPDASRSALNFQVRLSSPAPTGGVRFDIATGGGSATPGVDYVAKRQTGQIIPQGQTTYWFQVEVLNDSVVEGDETVGVSLSNVSGMALFDANAIGAIRNDDPRTKISGRILLPDGLPWTGAPFAISACSQEQGMVWPSDCDTALIAADGTYSIGALAGSNVTLELYPPDPYAQQSVDLRVVYNPIALDITLIRAAFVSGRVRWPDGAPAPTGDLRVSLQQPYRGDGLVTEYQYARSPNYAYRFKVSPGSQVTLGVEKPPAPYVSQLLSVGMVRADITRNIELRGTPSISISHITVSEDDGYIYPPSMLVRLSAPAPAGGTRFKLATFDGSAMSDNDYEPFSIDISVPAGQTLLHIQPIGIKYDPWKEADETFGVTARSIVGAWLPANGFAHVLDDDSSEPPTWTPGDFHMDGRSDVVWRNSVNGLNSDWHGPSFSYSRMLASVPDQAWKVMGIGDFDNDYQADIFWRNVVTGRNTIWLRGEWQSQRDVATMADPRWQVAGVGDFNADKRSDIFWRHDLTGSNLIWKSANSSSAQAVTGVANKDWKIAGVGDFDGDQRDDILWRNARTGGNVVWRSANGAVQLPVTAVTNTDWAVTGVGDFNGDKQADIFWRNGKTGANVIWLSANSARQRPVRGVSNVDWRMETTGDYNGDGQSDVIWRNHRLGSNAVWLSADSASPGSMPSAPLAWQIVP